MGQIESDGMLQDSVLVVYIENCHESVAGGVTSLSKIIFSTKSPSDNVQFLFNASLNGTKFSKRSKTGRAGIMKSIFCTSRR